MNPFQYSKAKTANAAVKAHLEHEKTAYLAGGTNLIDQMRRDVIRPDYLIDVTELPFSKIERVGNVLRLGALASNSDTADNALVLKDYPMVSEAILLGATDQLRNKATNGGNLMQNTRCSYYMSPHFACNKRNPGSGCDAIKGHNRILSVLGTSNDCIASYPSDMCTALAALDAVVQIQTADGGKRALPLIDFRRLPGNSPEIDTNLKPGELITSIDLPETSRAFAKSSYYLKVRDRHSYAFALVSVAAAVVVENGIIKDARMALGSVAAKPWRDLEAEAMFRGKKPSRALFQQIADKVMKDAKGYGDNDYKIELGKRAIVKAFMKVTGLS
ncbi:xanthine dehydrogenase YagS FAD-binding subunit [Pedobacter sp. UYEF25]